MQLILFDPNAEHQSLVLWSRLEWWRGSLEFLRGDDEQLSWCGWSARVTGGGRWSKVARQQTWGDRGPQAKGSIQLYSFSRVQERCESRDGWWATTALTAWTIWQGIESRNDYIRTETTNRELGGKETMGTRGKAQNMTNMSNVAFAETTAGDPEQ